MSEVLSLLSLSLYPPFIYMNPGPLYRASPGPLYLRAPKRRACGWIECPKSGWTSQFTSSFFMAALIECLWIKIVWTKNKMFNVLCECVLFVLVCVIVWLEFCPGGWLKYGGEQGLGYLVMWERVKIGILKIVVADITKLSWLTEGCRCNVGINIREESVIFRTSGILVY